MVADVRTAPPSGSIRHLFRVAVSSPYRGTAKGRVPGAHQLGGLLHGVGYPSVLEVSWKCDGRVIRR